MSMMAMKLGLAEPISRQLWVAMPLDMRWELVKAGKFGFWRGVPVVQDEMTLGVLRDIEMAIAAVSSR